MNKSAFMVMPFTDEIVKNAYDYVVKPVFEKMGINIRKADEMWSVNPIYDDIVAEIHGASVIVVDISGKNPNVFYELGIAHTLKRERTIILTHDKISSTPFDVAHFRIIQYSDSIEASKKLETALENTVKLITFDSFEEHINEFEAVFQIYRTSPMLGTSEFIELAALEQNNGSIEKGMSFTYNYLAADGEKSRLGGWSAKPDETFDQFSCVGYVEEDEKRYYITDKGKLFIKFLKETKNMKTFDYKFYNDDTESS